jgi:hypothetical protein
VGAGCTGGVACKQFDAHNVLSDASIA